jgi:putative transcriptional regulator
MAKRNKVDRELRGKARLRAELVKAVRGLRKIGAVGDAELEKTTLRMLGRDALPKVDEFSPAEIARLRERVGVSQAVLAGFLNVAVNTISQWERGERKPSHRRGNDQAALRAEPTEWLGCETAPADRQPGRRLVPSAPSFRGLATPFALARHAGPAIFWPHECRSRRENNRPHYSLGGEQGCSPGYLAFRQPSTSHIALHERHRSCART